MNQQAIIRAVATDLDLATNRVAAAVKLFDAGNTIPFVARYRKELTESLDEAELRDIDERLNYRRNMESRRETILRSMEEQEVLTPELEEQVRAADTLRRLEDLYRPYKPKRRTRATMAREKGLQPLADLILAQNATEDREALAAPYLSDEVPDAAEAFAGARDIVAETISDDPEIRAEMRTLTQKRGTLAVEVADEANDPDGVYEIYYQFFTSPKGLQPYQILAMNRGEREGVLKINLETPESEALGRLTQHYPGDMGSSLTEFADAHAIDVFAINLRSLLLQPPLRGQTVLGIDPGYRTGCKVAVVDPTGKVLSTTTIYPDRHAEQATAKLRALIKQHGVTVIAIGNGTASRETEALVAQMVSESKSEVKYTIVSEDGASVYSASPLAREELPDLDVALRGAVSIARRLQDPLAELVKIDPKAIGVGLYQHDVNQSALASELDVVVESVVNTVGADLNTASPALLQFISGIGPKTAASIVQYRDETGAFATRGALTEVSGIGPKTFEQAAGFLRVPNSEEPLDNTPIHPESYEVARAVLDLLGKPLGDPDLKGAIHQLRRERDLDELAAKLGTGRPTLEDILEALARPGRDPREDLEGPVLRSDVLSIEDLREGMTLKGTVRNVVDFGAFVDIGVKRAGLIHISKMGRGYVHSPHDKVAVGDVVDVEVISVDVDRGRIGLALIE